MPDENHLVIGLDASTTAVKAVAWDLTGKAVHEARSPLRIDMPRPGWHEQDAFSWWFAACNALRGVADGIASERFLGLSIAHQRESFVAVDAQGDPIYPALLWLDQRAAPLMPGLKARLDPLRFHQRTGKPLSANLAPGKLEWLRCSEPAVFSAAHSFLDTHAFLVHHLTGEWVTSSGSADPLGTYDLSNSRWDAETLACLGLTADRMPRVVPPGQVIGCLTESAALQTGLPAGLPVFAGLGDGQAGSLGSGLASLSEASISLGTSVIGGVLSPTCQTSDAFRTMTAAAPGTYILETVLLGGAYTLQWLITDLLRCPDFPTARGELEAEAALLPPGSQGLVLLPYWNGVMNPYWDASASGALIGLRGIHQREHLFRAVLEGIGFELRFHLEGVERALNAPIERLLVSGGGAQSPLWRSILSSIYSRPVFHATTAETAALGAGILAAVGSGAYPNIASAVQNMVHTAASPDLPSQAAVPAYDQLYTQVYSRIYPCLREPFAALAKFSNQ